MTLILIPARGGSKGIPRKNLRTVGGIPLVGRAARLGRRVAAALGPGARVVCSTDDGEIAAAARCWGAEVPFLRPAELATDTASSVAVLFHALAALGERFDVVVVLQPTSPLTEMDDVLRAVEPHRSSGDAVVTVCRNEHPLEWSFTLGADGRLAPAATAPAVGRRQDSAPTYRLNGAVYVSSPEKLAERGGFVGPGTRGLEMPAERSVDVDRPDDLVVANALLDSRPVPPVGIAGRQVGPGHPCFVIAEAGVNHNGDLDMALRLVGEAAAAGADAVKFQTFHAERVVSPATPQAAYQSANTGREEPMLEMIRRLELPDDAFATIAAQCREKGVLFLSSPFDLESVDLLDSLGVPAFKVGSGELTHHALLAHIASKGKPILLSTGMSSLDEVARAVDVIAASGAPPVALLHCVSNYPTDPTDCNLAAMGTLRDAFRVPVGWSDHTLGIHVAMAAAARGASLVEKHFTVDRSLPGPDHRASLQPSEFAELVRQVREVESAIGAGAKQPAASERDTAQVARRSLHAARAIAAGQVIRVEDLLALRPGTGIGPERLAETVGRRAARAIPAGAMLAEKDFE